MLPLDAPYLIVFVLDFILSFNSENSTFVTYLFTSTFDTNCITNIISIYIIGLRLVSFKSFMIPSHLFLVGIIEDVEKEAIQVPRIKHPKYTKNTYWYYQT